MENKRELMQQEKPHSIDGFLDQSFFVYQPRTKAHRAGLDAVLVASAVDAQQKGRVADFGSGCGAAGMAVAHRCKGALVDLIEKDQTMHELAQQSLLLPQNAALASRLHVIKADLTAKGSQRFEQGLKENSYDCILSNPPYNSAAYQASHHAKRADAHMMGEGLFDAWVKTAASLAAPKAPLIMIIRPDGLDVLLRAFGQRFGAPIVLPIHSKADSAANRLIVKAVKGAKGPLQILPSFIIHQADGSFTEKAEALLRGKAGLMLM